MKVAVLMGSKSDADKMEGASEVLEHLGIEHEVYVMSAHRTPSRVADFASSARENGFGVIICGAGKAAHLAGAVAAHSTIPVIGVPVDAGGLGGLDALLATVQMPTGVPVATVAIDSSANAAYLAAAILSLSSPDIAKQLDEYRQSFL